MDILPEISFPTYMSIVPVSCSIIQVSRNLTYYSRQAHSIDSAHHVSTFSPNTSTSTLRKHLINDHIEEWISSCEDLGIEITAAAAQAAIRRFRNQPAETPLETNRPQYSQEAFVDALVEFIVGDDLVWI